MTCCGHCRDAEAFFTRRTARRELRRYRRWGPTRSTRLLLDALRAQGTEGASLLDVGGGVGVIQHELLRAGVRNALHVDACSAYLDAAGEEARRLGVEARREGIHGDFVELAPGLGSADLVTLDRVICCYPDLDRLLEASISRTRRVLGLVYPRERAIAKGRLAAGNLWFRLRGSVFRVFLHPPTRVRALVEGSGFRRVSRARTFLWRIETYLREG